jgi:uncharacterized protein
VRVWIDLANSPHVPLFIPVVRRLRDEGQGVLLTVRDHAQTFPLARDAWPDVVVIGEESPPGRLRKVVSITSRAWALRRFATSAKPDVALSHGSYAQIIAARLARIPAVTMMDYEYQPANHVSFRLARRVIVPAVFPAEALRRFGAAERKVVRYEGFKEELYLSGRHGNGSVLDALGVDHSAVVAVLRPPPDGALYHRGENSRFEEVLADLEHRSGVAVVVLPRSREQHERYGYRHVTIPEAPVDGTALLAAADLVIGGGGTMTREAALLGTPTYTVFMPELAAVDAELIRLGRITDLREPGRFPRVEKKQPRPQELGSERGAMLYATVVATLRAVNGAG